MSLDILCVGDMFLLTRNKIISYESRLETQDSLKLLTLMQRWIDREITHLVECEFTEHELR